MVAESSLRNSEMPRKVRCQTDRELWRPFKTYPSPKSPKRRTKLACALAIRGVATDRYLGQMVPYHAIPVTRANFTCSRGKTFHSESQEKSFATKSSSRFVRKQEI